MTHPPRSVRALHENGRLTDILVELPNGRSLAMLGGAGVCRELAILPAQGFPPDPEAADDAAAPPQPVLPVMIGSGTGAALEELCARLRAVYGPEYRLAVVDKEQDILDASGVRERYGHAPGIEWIDEAHAESALRHLSDWQERNGGKPLLPLVNPFYLRLDRDWYAAIRHACEASAKADFWSKARYRKFTEETPRILLLTSQYFLMGEITAACERLDLPHRLLRVPDGELGHNEFVETLLKAVVEFRPDFVFTINHLGVDREGALMSLLEKLRLPLASWFVDNPHLILYLYDRLVNPWTCIFTWDADNLDSLKTLGFEHVQYLPLGVDACRFRPSAASPNPIEGSLPASWNRHVAFVGNSMVHKVRERMRRSHLPPILLNSYKEIAARFADEDERSVSAFLQRRYPEQAAAFEALPDMEQRLNFETMLTWEATLQYRLSCVRGVMPFSPLIVGDDGWQAILPQTGWQYRAELNYYSELPSFYPCADINFNCTSKQMKGAVNQRVFDVPATGSFLLTDYREQVENLFAPGTEIVCYRSPEEAAGLAREYLERPADRRKIAEAARNRILQQHTYEHRVRELCAVMRRLYS